jgi:hypothetical protein
MVVAGMVQVPVLGNTVVEGVGRTGAGGAVEVGEGGGGGGADDEASTVTVA